jgi:hypothetical protein
LEAGSYPRPLRVVARVTAVNAAGLNASLVLVVKMDDSPPVAGVVAFEAVDVEAKLVHRMRVIANATSLADWALNSTGSLTDTFVATVDYSNPPRYQVSRRRLSFVWTGFYDPQQESYTSGPLSYYHAVGTAPGADDVARWTRHYLPAIEVLNSTNGTTDYGFFVTNDAKITVSFR